MDLEQTRGVRGEGINVRLERAGGHRIRKRSTE